MVLSPVSESAELSVDGISEGLELSVEVLIDYLGSSVVEVSKEDESNVILKAKLKVGVLTLESLEFNDKLLDEERQGELHLEGSLVLGWHSHNPVNLDSPFDNFLDRDLNNLGE